MRAGLSFRAGVGVGMSLELYPYELVTIVLPGVCAMALVGYALYLIGG